MVDVEREAMYEIIAEKIDGIAQILHNESLNTLSNDDLTSLTAQLMVAAQYMQTFSVERYN